MNHWPWVALYVLLLAEGFIVAMALVPLTISIGMRWGFVARPGGRHIHSQPTPALGGLAIVGSFLAVILANLVFAHFFHDSISGRYPQVGAYLVNIPSVLKQLAAVLGGSLVMLLLGIVDDKRPLLPELKLLVMVVAVLPLLWAGIRIEGFLPWAWAGSLLTVFWVVFVTNSFNFLDNMDGLCAGVAAIVAVALGLVSFSAHEWFMTAIYAVLAGSLLGFLRHNFHPARVFMGDNGSLFIGYLLGALTVLSTYYEHGVGRTPLPILTPIIVLGVPIFDTVSVLWIRWRTGKPLMRGDTNHFSHRLTDLGMTPRRAVTFIYIVTAAVALAAVPLRGVGRAGAFAILAQTALIFWIIYRLERTAKNKKR